jgi:FkbM family methyltransferase
MSTLMQTLGHIGRAALGPAATSLFRGDFSYSGAGEDRLVLSWLSTVYGLSETEIRYCDIGANHPRKLSNTFAMYQRGARGILVEPDPQLADLLRRDRPRDIVLNVGAAFDERRSATLMRFNSSVFNTFSEAQADLITNSSKNWRPDQLQDIQSELEIQLVHVNDILSQIDALHFLSIDAEGVDLPILRAIDFNVFRPKMICIEASADFDPVLKPYGYEMTARTPDNVIYRVPR